MNQKGHPASLRASQPGNSSALTHGAFSRRAQAPRAREIADALLGAPHTVPFDRPAADEIGALIAMLELIDEELLANGLTDRRGKARGLLELRVRASGRLERWLREFGATPASRVQWVHALMEGKTLADVVRDELAVGGRLVEAARDRGDLEPAEAESEHPE